MTLSATVLFDRPQCPVSATLRSLLAQSKKTQVVSGFLTVEGIELLLPILRSRPTTLDTLVVGAGTYRAFEGLDKLLGIGVSPHALCVHLGHGRKTGTRAKHRFYRYHPMLHSKVYYTERADGTAAAVIGSHNITGFALGGLNGEAAVLIEGPVGDIEFQKVRDHIDEAKRQSVAYSPDKKEALAWWTKESFEGIRDKANDTPRDSKNLKTIVIIAENLNHQVPHNGETVYFELPLALGQVNSLRSEVHVYIFDKLPATPWQALQTLDQAIGSCWCRPLGLELASGGVELLADWEITGNKSARLVRTIAPFRPTPTNAMQQVRVEAFGRVRGRFEYLFSSDVKKWIPVLAEDSAALIAQNEPAESLEVDSEFREVLMSLELKPNAEHYPWMLVKDLEPEEPPERAGYEKALRDFSPQGGSYVMFSVRRRDLDS